MKFSHITIIEGDPKSTDKESKKICISILGEKFKYKINKSICSDILYIDSKSKKSIGISEVRKIQSEVLLKPVECEYKIYIFKNAQNLTEQAQNALLKILEDPPKHVIFLFLCTNCRKLIPTVLSRASIIHINDEDQTFTTEDLNKLINAVQNNNKFDILALGEKIEVYDFMFKSHHYPDQ